MGLMVVPCVSKISSERGDTQEWAKQEHPVESR